MRSLLAVAWRHPLKSPCGLSFGAYSFVGARTVCCCFLLLSLFGDVYWCCYRRKQCLLRFAIWFARCETLNKKIIIRVLCIVALALSSADLVLVLIKTGDRENVKAYSFQIKARNNDNDFSLSGFAVAPNWQELSLSAHYKEVRQ